MSRGTIISLGEIYHIYNRGVDKRSVFVNKKDKDRFVKLLYLCNNKAHIVYRDFQNENISDIKIKERLVDIGAYCVMNNHFHILIKEVSEGGVTKFLSKLSTAYAMYFNKRYKRTGTLFESSFKVKHCNCDTYLKYLFSYIHLNPLKLYNPDWKTGGSKNITKLKNYLDSYTHSSYHEYFSPSVPRQQSVIIFKQSFPEYFNNNEFESFIDYWIRYDDICSEMTNGTN